MINGTKIHFYPDDIKALLSIYFANLNYDPRPIGTLCQYNSEADIPSDPVTGLWIDPACSSIDPGAFLIIITNQIGIKNLNLIVDPNQDSQIWNQGINRYFFSWYLLTSENDPSLTYNHNPMDNVLLLANLQGHAMSFLNFLWQQGPAEAVYVVGVEIFINYAIGNTAMQMDTTDSTYTEDRFFRAGIYLDQNYKIVGGSWRDNVHPEFLWGPDKTTTFEGINDDKCATFDGTVQSLKLLTQYAKDASSSGLPLTCIIQYLSKNSS